MTDEERKIARKAMADGMEAQKELRWASTHMNPNIAFTKTMAVVGGIVAALLLLAVIDSGGEGWPLLFFVAMFGALPFLAPSVIRDDLADKQKAEEIVAKWDARIDELVK